MIEQTTMFLTSRRTSRQWNQLILTRIEEIETQSILDQHHEFERLEFLGDSILNAFVTKHLYLENPEETEGELSAKKSFLVSNAYLKDWTISKAGIKFVLDKDLAKRVEKFSDKVVGSMMEGFIGFMHQFRGPTWVHKFLEKNFWPIACKRLSEGQWQSYRSLVQMLFQKRFQTLPEFNVTEVTVFQDEEHRFRAQLVVETEIVAVGFGKSKKKAIENASRMYWRNENEALPGT
jgi:ribonuclease III